MKLLVTFLAFVALANADAVQFAYCDTGPTCIRDCAGLADGDYQSCMGCAVYASCTNGVMVDGRPCAELDLVWDDNAKTCEYSSETCTECDAKCECTGAACVTSCAGLDDGDYQSCKQCSTYVTCSNGNMYDDRHCPWIPTGVLVWDDALKRCEWASATCQECVDPTLC